MFVGMASIFDLVIYSHCLGKRILDQMTLSLHPNTFLSLKVEVLLIETSMKEVVRSIHLP